MRVVIAGSSGLIGSALVQELRSTGHQVIRLVRRRATDSDERSWDPQNKRIQTGALADVDAVVNLGGAGLGDRRWTPERKEILLDSRIRTTEALSTLVAEHNIPVFVSGSAVGYYGNTGSTSVTEKTAAGQGFLADLCQRWEAATTPALDAGVRVCRIRTGLVLSRRGGLLGRLRPLFSLMLGGRLGGGYQYMPWISLADEVGAIRFILENSRISGPVNLTGPAPVTNTEFTKALAEAVQRPAPWIVPEFALKLALGSETATEMALSGQRAMPEVLHQHGYPFQHTTIQAALADAVHGAS